jgi:hypothetical protein
LAEVLQWKAVEQTLDEILQVMRLLKLLRTLFSNNGCMVLTLTFFRRPEVPHF